MFLKAHGKGKIITEGENKNNKKKNFKNIYFTYLLLFDIKNMGEERK